MFVPLTNDTTYLTGNEGQKFRAVLSENAKLERLQHCTANAIFIAAENAYYNMLISTSLPRPGPLALCVTRSHNEGRVTTPTCYLLL